MAQEGVGRIPVWFCFDISTFHSKYLNKWCLIFPSTCSGGGCDRCHVSVSLQLGQHSRTGTHQPCEPARLCEQPQRVSAILWPTPAVKNNLFLKIEFCSDTVPKLSGVFSCLTALKCMFCFPVYHEPPVKEEPISGTAIDCFLPYSSFWMVMLQNLVREGMIYPNQNWIKSRLCLQWISYVFFGNLLYSRGSMWSWRLGCFCLFFTNWILCFYKEYKILSNENLLWFCAHPHKCFWSSPFSFAFRDEKPCSSHLESLVW